LAVETPEEIDETFVVSDGLVLYERRMELWWAERLLKHYVVRTIKLINGKLLTFITLLD
jgi:hypothetical protein